MPIKDNRQFIAALEKTGDLVRIKEEVDWDQEMGAMVRRTNELQGPALFFENITDYPGYKVFGSPLATVRRIATLFGMDPRSSFREVQHAYEERIERPLKPRIVKSGYCKQNILKGDEVDLFSLPVPLIHTGDGGRYIGTWHAVVTKDPDTGWTNYGMYRMMAYGKKYTSVYLHTGNHGGKIFLRKYKAARKPMPISIAIGPDPATAMMASCYVRSGENEIEYAGALIGEPIDLVKCESNDLLVPASSEIVLEGAVLPDITIQEGPFGEFPGYRTQVGQKTVMRVDVITFRNNPILTMTNMGIPVEDSDITMPISAAAIIKKRLKENNIKVTDVYLPPESDSAMVVVGVKVDRPGLALQIGNLVFVQGIGETKVIVVDDDVDVFNMTEVLHTLANKCNPKTGVHIIDLPYSVPLTAYLSVKDRAADRGYRLILDCTWPFDWSKENEVPPRMSFNDEYSEQIKQKVLSKLKKYNL